MVNNCVTGKTIRTSEIGKINKIVQTCQDRITGSRSKTVKISMMGKTSKWVKPVNSVTQLKW